MLEERVRYVLGIDPGVQTGFAVWDTRLKVFSELKTTEFWPLYADVLARFPVETTEIVVECPGLNSRVVYARHDSEQGGGRRERMAGNIGSNRREAVLLVEGFRRAGYRVREERPQARKWDAAQFKRLTGVERRTSQHVRDAARLCSFNSTLVRLRL